MRPGSLGSVLDFLGTQTSGTDVYVSATKLLAQRSWLPHPAWRISKTFCADVWPESLRILRLNEGYDEPLPPLPAGLELVLPTPI